MTSDDEPTVKVHRKSARVSGPGTPETWVDDGVANTLNTFDVTDVRTTHAVVTATGAVTHSLASEGHDASEDGTGQGTPIITHEVVGALKGSPGRGWTNSTESCADGHLVPLQTATAFAQNQCGEVREMDVAPAVTSGGGKPGEGYSAVRTGPSVRRLTPMECERLQGWPDGWTDIPWRGKDHAPDSRRYAAAGNGVTAPVAYWIAARLAEVLGD